ncbi:class I SAM-dependent methyltransferase [Actinophytocola sp.]|uniref:class I SAM-dependent methyltransferase n=1 Tax=Actinophytocola sp. TaxID=1872138 RepID=UPI002D4C1A10|nr:class I SAM-dependent methyltransferase [Actinophytocola sp.]HYQ69279.1 class I SAM-dependent methyltransferase [Actinophytocola sp.]
MQGVAAETAIRWLQRWDAQQERYVPDREERFRVVIDVVREVIGGGPAGVVDLGCGPGSLSQRLAEALPEVHVVGVDADPLLLGLGQANTNPRVRSVEADLTNPGWPDATGLPGPWDAAVSSTALHWLTPEDLGQLYRTLAANLRPGGVFVNADNLGLGQPALDTIAEAIRAARTRRVGTERNEDWAAWWQALQEDDDLAPLLDARSDAAIAHSSQNSLTVWQHAELLRQAGFAEAGPVWQFGDDHVLVAVR